MQFLSSCLVFSNITNCDLTGAFFCGCDLRHTLFIDSDCTGVIFLWSNLAYANFTNTDLTGADFRDVDLSTVSGLVQEQINSAIVNRTTKLPKNLKLPENLAKDRFKCVVPAVAPRPVDG